MLNEVIHGDALEVLRSLPTHSVDAIVTDPPAGIAFMGKDWDNFSGKKKTYDSEAARNAAYNSVGKGASPFGYSGSGMPTKQERDAFIDFMANIFSEALRVIKPGGHALIWALPRTSHWTALALEYAGFDIRDCITHIFGSGMPKSHDISKAIDRLNGHERELVQRVRPDGKGAGYASSTFGQGSPQVKRDETPASPEAAQWAGWGSGLKPACEIWYLARAPLSEHSIAANVLRWGTGGLNIDKCRISTDENTSRIRGQSVNAYEWSRRPEPMKGKITGGHSQGRWPANLLLSHTLFCVPLGEKKVKGTAPHGKPTVGIQPKPNNTYNLGLRSGVQHSDADGTETVEAWECAPGCPVALLDMQSGVRKSGAKTNRKGDIVPNGHIYNPMQRTHDTSYTANEGYASRYFKTFHETPDVPFIYTSKASRTERNRGCEALPVSTNEDTNLLTSSWRTDPRSPNGGYENKPTAPRQNNHPTVKPISLMRYLVNLITPPGGLVLDMFGGSGSTGVACIMEGYNYILVEQDSDYCEIARARLAYATQNAYTCKDNMTI